MSARRKQLIALSVVLVCVIGMAAYGIVRVSNKTADKENGFDVAMTDTTSQRMDQKIRIRQRKRKRRIRRVMQKRTIPLKKRIKRKRLCLHWI